SGVGKTTLVQHLAATGLFTMGLEEHFERPFQQRWARDPMRYGLANQVDYLLFRAEQERALRAAPQAALQDGGLDLDFYGFTKLFHARDLLSQDEFVLCQRLHGTLRAMLGPVDLIIRLTAPLAVIQQRYRQRNRAVEITASDDLRHLDLLIDDWLQDANQTPVLTIDGTAGDLHAAPNIAALSRTIQRLLDQSA
ncbi:MAG: deoxynucleoside kinase, partial [Caldilineaceae bacterium]|nr:deoxynucleoside kinase [Caldilineaceae bacterium]